jgi:hypothetical protein
MMTSCTHLAASKVSGYPRKWLLCAILLIGGAGCIELLQFLSPTRHAEVDDHVSSIQALAFTRELGCFRPGKIVLWLERKLCIRFVLYLPKRLKITG